MKDPLVSWSLSFLFGWQGHELNHSNINLDDIESTRGGLGGGQGSRLVSSTEDHGDPPLTMPLDSILSRIHRGDFGWASVPFRFNYRSKHTHTHTHINRVYVFEEYTNMYTACAGRFKVFIGC